jgi:preprotein translocase subunit SecE
LSYGNGNSQLQGLFIGIANLKAEKNVANKANKTKKSSPAKSNDSNVVRIKASSAPSSKKKVDAEANVTKVVATSKTAKPTKAVKAEKVKTPRSKKGIRGFGVFRSIGGYFKGAWVELRQVRWPNRRATWGLTGAVLLYTAFFVVLVLLLDAAFKYLFELILGK